MKKQIKGLQILSPTIKNRNSICPFDFCRLSTSKVLTVDHKGKIRPVQTYRCPLCHRNYIRRDEFDDMSTIGIGPKDYINLNLKKETPRTKLSNIKQTERVVAKKDDSSSTLITDDTDRTLNSAKGTIPSPKMKALSKSISNKTISPPPKSLPREVTSETAEGYVLFGKLEQTKRCFELLCNSDLDKTRIQYKIKNGNIVNSHVKKCPVCNKYYVRYTVYKNNPNMIKFLNVKEMREYEKKKQEKEVRRIEQRIQENQAWAIKEAQKAKNAKSKHKGITHPKNASNRSLNRFDTIRKEALKAKKRKYYNEIQFQDFLIKRSVFRCYYKDHELEDITANVKILNWNGKLETMKVSAGYCADCSVYFIFDETYKEIQRRGTPVCRVYDWKTIESDNATEGNMRLASESILRQYGYNVNANEGLSSEKRQHILQLIVDNNILTKSEIISYLDFFINQRKNNKAMKTAVEKWQSDKQFIQSYRMDSFENYQIRSIKKT